MKKAFVRIVSVLLVILLMTTSMPLSAVSQEGAIINNGSNTTEIGENQKNSKSKEVSDSNSLPLEGADNASDSGYAFSTAQVNSANSQDTTNSETVPASEPKLVNSDSNGFAEEIPTPTFPDDDSNENTYAGGIEINEDAFQLRLNSDNASYSVVGFLASASTMNIPATYKGLPVNRIAEYAFENNHSLKKVTIPDSVEYIGTGAFSSTAPIDFEKYENAKYLGNSNNKHLYLFSIIDSGVSEFTIHKDTKIIAAYALQNCKNITEINVPESVLQIGFRAFRHMDNLESITLPFIGETGSASSNAHFGYIFGAQTYGGNISYIPESLRSVKILDCEQCERIAKGSMYGVDMITSLTLPYLGENINDTEHAFPCWVYGYDTYEGNQYLPESITFVEIAHLKEVNENTFKNCTSVTGIVLKDTDTIGTKAFYNFNSLSSVEIPENVTEISDYTFYGCTGLTSIIIPENINQIGNYAFYNCSGLTSIALPNEVTMIGKYAFYGCIGLSSVIIPENVIQIGNYAFYGCTDLLNVVTFDNISSIGEYAFHNTGYYNDNSNWVDGVLYISKHLISAKTTLSDEYSIASGTKTICRSAFENCSKLTKIIIPNSVSDIGNSAFLNCSNLTDIFISDSVTSIGSMAFYNCSSLTNAVIPNSVTSIGGYAFYNCLGLTAATIGNGVKSIESSAFYKCSNLSDVYINSISAWCSISFADQYSNPLYYAQKLYLNNELVTELIVPDSVTSIGNLAFYNCSSLTSAVIPESVTSIENSAFNGCSGIKELSLPCSAELQYYSFENCINIEKITITKGTGIMQDYSSTTAGIIAYYQATPWYKSKNSIKQILLEEGITNIGPSAFYNCTGLTEISIPESVLSIGIRAFYGCSELTSVEFKYSEGWTVNGNAVDVSDSGSAAQYLKQTYAAYQWVRNTETTEESVPSSNTNPETTDFDVIQDDSLSENREEIGTEINDEVYPIDCDKEEESTAGLESQSSLEELNDTDCEDESALLDLSEGTSEKDLPDEQIEEISEETKEENDVTVEKNTDEAVEDKKVETSNSAKSTSKKSNSSVSNDSPKTNSGSNAVSVSKKTSVSTKHSNTKNASLSSEGLAFSLVSNGASYFVSGIGTCTDTDIIIPSEYNGLPVTRIGESAFRLYSDLKSIIIPEGITSISSYAFQGCTGLTEIVIPDSVTSIGNNAFDGCSGLKELTLPCSAEIKYSFANCTNIERITITKGTGVMLNYGDTNYQYTPWYISRNNLKQLILEEGITSIGSYAFYNCSGVTSIVIPDTVTSIGDSAFYNCSGLKELILPCSAKIYNSSNTFSNCTNIEKITITKGTGIMQNNSGSTGNSDTYYIYTPWYVSRNSLKQLTLEEGITSIGSYAFRGYSGASITIPESVNSIGDYSFTDCSSLKSIIIPEGVTSIGGGAFSGCTGLTSAVIPDSVTNIGARAFNNCSGLTSISIPDGVTSIGNYTFYNCSGLTSVSVPDSVTIIGDYAFYGCSGLTSVAISNNVTSIGNYAFYNCSSLTSVVIPDSVTSVGNSAFDGCSDLSEVTIGNSVRTIGLYAFNNCENISSVYIDDVSVWAKIDYANWSANPLFYKKNLYLNNELITELIIPNGITKIGSYAFYGFSGLTIVEIPESVTSIGSSAFYGCRGLTEINIPDSVTSIGSYAFYNCSGLTSVLISNGVRSIGEYAFYGLSGISNLIIPDSVVSIGFSAFGKWSSLETVSLPFIGGSLYLTDNSHFGYIFGATDYNNNKSNVPNSLRNVVITGKIAIDNNSFSGCENIAHIEISSKVFHIGSKAFDKCNNLLINYLGEKNEWRFMERATDWAEGSTNLTVSFAPSKGFLCEMSEDASEIFIGEYDYTVSQNSTATIPDTFAGKPVTKILNEAFYKNDMVTEIIVSESIIIIGSRAFANCSNLKKIIIPDSVQELGLGILSGTLLNELSFSFNAKTNGNNDVYFGYLFGAKAYYEIAQVLPKTLKTVHIIGDAVIPDYAFYDCESIEKIDIQGAPEEIGNYAFAYCRALTEFVIPDSVEKIGKSILYYCNSVSTISIGAGVSSLGDISSGNALFGLSKTTSLLKKYTVSPENSVFCADSYGILYQKMAIPYSDGTRYIPVSIVDVPAGAELSGYAVPDHIVEIKPYAFAYNNSLNSIELSYIRSIGKYAFYENNSLLTVTLGEPEEVESDFWDYIETIQYSQYIGEGAFMGCDSLIKINIETPMLVGIGNQVFFDCGKLKKVILGENIQRIGLRAFGSSYSGQSSLEDFFVPFENLWFKSIDGVLYEINEAGDLTLLWVPACLVKLDYQYDAYGHIVSQTSKASGGEYLYVKEFILPNKDNYNDDIAVSEIESYAFESVRFMEDVDISPNNDIKIGDYVFSGSSIQTVNIGANVQSLGLKRGEGEYTVFADCLYLTDIHVESDNEYYRSVDGVLFDKTMSKLIKYPSAKVGAAYVIPETVASISSMAFKENHSLQTVTINSYISSIGLEAFYQCSNLAVVFFDDVYAPTSIMENAFTTYYPSETVIGYNPSKLNNGESKTDFGWINYKDTYTLREMSVLPEIVYENTGEGDFYAIVLVDENGKRINGTVENGKSNFIVSLTDPNGTTETVYAGVDENGLGDGIAVFYNLYGNVNLGFSINYDLPYKLRVSDVNGGYYTFTSNGFYLDLDTCITYVTMVKKEMTVQFDFNGGTGIAQGFTTVIGEYTDISDRIADRFGYTFMGWSTEQNGAVEYTTGFETMKYSPYVVLHAVWQANTNTLSFNAGTHGSGSMEVISLQTDETINLPECGYTASGYEFLGWALSDSSEVVYLNGSEYTSDGTEAVTLYARWKGNENTVVFLPEGGQGSMSSITVVTDETCIIPENAFTRKGYTFVHWVDENGRVYESGDEYTSSDKAIQTLSAVWQADYQTLTLLANDSSGRTVVTKYLTDQVVSLADNPFERKGYFQIGWSYANDGSIIDAQSMMMPGEDLTLFSVWVKLPEIYGLNLDEADINSEAFTLNKAQYGSTYSGIELKDPSKGFKEDNIVLVGETSETVDITAIVYCDTEYFNAINLQNCYLTQNGIVIQGAVINSESIVKNDDSYILSFSVPVDKLIPEVPVEIHSAIEHLGQIVKSSNFLLVNIIDFSLSESDINLDMEDLSIDLSQAGSNLLSLLGSKSWDFNLGKNAKVNIALDGDKIKVSLNAGFNKSKTTGTNNNNSTDYKKGYNDNVVGNHHGNTWRFAKYFIIPKLDGIHKYKMNIWFARGTETSNYYYYRCSVYDLATKNQVNLFYGVVNAIGGRKECAVKADLISYTYGMSAIEKKDAAKGEKYIEPILSTSIKPAKSTKNSFEATIYGDIEFQYQKGKGLVPTTSEIKGEIKYPFQHNQQFFVWIIPVNISIKVDVDGKAEISLKYDEERIVTVEEAKLTIDVEVAAKAGIGGSVVSAGVTGNIGTVFVMHFAPQFGIESWEIHGGIGLYATYVTVKWNQVWGPFGYFTFGQETSTVDIYSFSGYIIDNRAQFEKKPDAESESELDSLYSVPLALMFFPDAYEPAEPDEYYENAKIFTVGDKIYKIGFVNMYSDFEYKDENEESVYDRYNYLKLALFEWNLEQSEWSFIRLLDKNGYNDFAFDVYQTEDNVFIVFTQQTVRTTQETVSDMQEYVSEIAVKSITLQDVISERSAACVSADSYYKYLSTSAVVDGKLTAVWVENTDNNMFGISNDNYVDKSGNIHIFETAANSIWVSEYDSLASSWSEPFCIKSGLSAITDLAITESGFVAYIVDENGNLGDSQDRMLYRINLKDGNTNLVTEFNHEYATSIVFAGDGFVYGSTADETNSLKFVQLNNGNSSIYFPENVSEIPENYEIVFDETGNPVAIVYAKNISWKELEDDTESVSGGELFGMFFDGENWGSPIAIRTDSIFAVKNRYISSFSAVLIGNRLMIVVEYVDENGVPQRKETQYFNLISDISLEDFEISYAEHTVNIVVANNGAVSTGIYALINGENIITIADTIKSGETKELSIDFSAYKNNVSLSLFDASANKQIGSAIEFNAQSSDLKPVVKQLLLGKDNTLLVAVKNAGNVADCGKLYVAIGNHSVDSIKQTGTEFGFATVLPGKIVYVEIPLVNELEVDENTIISIYAESTDNNEKGDNALNNLVFTTVKAFNSEVQEDGSSYIPELEETYFKYYQEDEIKSDVIVRYFCSSSDALKSVNHDEYTLVSGLDYDVTEDSIILKTSYLDTLEYGDVFITVEFLSGYSKTVTIKVVAYYDVVFSTSDEEQKVLRVSEGVIPIYEGTPVKASTQEYEYEFLGWDFNGDNKADPLQQSSRDITYNAVWLGTKRAYSITWSFESDNGVVSVTEKYAYGATPDYKGNAFTPSGKEFNGWDVEISDVTGDKVYTALYKNAISVTPGDINGDGIVSIKDVTRLVNYLNDANTQVVEEVLDINGDGIVNIKDVTRLIAYLNDSTVLIY